MKTTFQLVAISLLLTVLFLSAFGWGWDTHRFFNKKVVYHLPNQMQLFIQDSAFFSLHSIDADARRPSPPDTNFYGEYPRHFLDIDDYPNFHALPRSLDSVITLYGWERVKGNGTNPWATIWVYDSLVFQLRRGDWEKAKLTASDLGHYVGDAHQPLHATVNYNGQFTNNSGIHSRYETTMLSSPYFLSSLAITPDSVRYISNRINYVFDYIIYSNSLLDTILRADTYAKSVSGWSGSGTAPSAYYTALWLKTKVVTLGQMQRGTLALANLWYSAWVDAGIIQLTNVRQIGGTKPTEFLLHQNYPNPFNPSTIVSYHLPVGGTVSMTLFAIDGREVRSLVTENQSAGDHAIEINGSNLTSGVYFCRLQLGDFSQTIRMVLLR